VTESRKHQEQFERIKRWYERIKDIYEGIPHERESDYYQDDVYAFFINCYHLKDWIKNDESVETFAKEKVQGFIDKNRELKLCRDICHSLKHLKRNTEGRSGVGSPLGPRIFRFNVSTGIIRAQYSITTETGDTFDAYELASRCVHLWEKFIEDNIE